MDSLGKGLPSHGFSLFSHTNNIKTTIIMKRCMDLDFPQIQTHMESIPLTITMGNIKQKNHFLRVLIKRRAFTRVVETRQAKSNNI